MDGQSGPDAESKMKPERDSRRQKADRPRDPASEIRHVDPMILWGTWPGDEPIEVLLDQLD